MQIRRIEEDDLEMLEAVESDLFYDTSVSAWTLRQELKAQDGFVVTGPTGHILGYILVHTTPGRHEITRVGVLSDYREQGLGRALVEYVLASGTEDFVLFVDANNTPAKCLYWDLGFTEVGYWPAFDNTKYFLMHRPKNAMHGTPFRMTHTCVLDL